LSEPDRNGISAKLWRLPGEFLLALINGTAILVIVAAILVLVAMVRIDNFAGNVVATMTEAALSKIDLPSKEVLANLRNLTEEVRTLGTALREIKTGENPVLQSEIARLKEALIALNASVDRLANARTILTDEAIGQLGQSVTETLTKMRGCASNIGQMQPHRTLGDNAAKSQDTIGWPLKWPHTVKMSGGRSIDAFPHHYSESDLISASLTDLTAIPGAGHRIPRGLTSGWDHSRHSSRTGSTAPAACYPQVGTAPANRTAQISTATAIAPTIPSHSL
jgi:hypothetical protein